MLIEIFESKSMLSLKSDVNSFMSRKDINVISHSLSTTMVGYSMYYTISVMYEFK